MHQEWKSDSEWARPDQHHGQYPRADFEIINVFNVVVAGKLHIAFSFKFNVATAKWFSIFLSFLYEFLQQ